MKNAFTLSEVLITLGIIGVVAALSLPSLINWYNKNVTLERLKKFYSVIKQANLLVMEEAGCSEMGFSFTDYSADNSYKQFYNYYAKYLNIAKNCRTNAKNGGCFPSQYYYLNKQEVPSTSTGAYAAFGLADGTSLRVEATGAPDNQHIIFLVDINGLRNPNIVGKDIFEFKVYNDGDVKFSWQGESRTSLTGKGQYGCNKQAVDPGFKCGALILYDGWNMKKDYPW